MKILTVIGARPQFIKAAPLSRLFKSEGIEEYLLHTGQHYNQNMSKIFFDELQIPVPKLNLSIGSASHGKQTGLMLIEIEKAIQNYKPDWVVVYGDTNSTLAGVLAASKLGIKTVHIESGLRSFDRSMPEEINRITADHLSNLLCCPSQNAVNQLLTEGIQTGVKLTGDIMYDAFVSDLKLSKEKYFAQNNKYAKNPAFALLTLHRPSNTNDIHILSKRLAQLEKLDLKVIWPIHPRNIQNLNKINKIPKNLEIIDPVGRLEILYLLSKCSILITDSGGLQKEAYWSNTLCFTLRNSTEWTETVESGWNTLIDLNVESLKLAYDNLAYPKSHENYYGDGNAAKLIYNEISNF